MRRRNFFKLLACACVAPFLPSISIGERDHDIAQMNADMAELWSKWSNVGIDTLGAGVLDTISAVRQDHAFVVDENRFYQGQTIQIYSADLNKMRGSRKIKEIKDGALILNSRVPGDTVPGDLILLTEYHMTSSVGVFEGLKRS